jgi:hypothetical protein
LFRQERSDPPKQSSAAFAHAGIVEQQGWPGCPQASHCDAMSTTTHVLPALHDVPQHGCPDAPHIDAEQIPATHETPGRQSMPGQHAWLAPPHGGALSTTFTGEEVSFAPSSLEASSAGPVLLASPVAASAPPSPPALALPPSSAAVTEPPQAATSAKPKTIATREVMTSNASSNATDPSTDEPDARYLRARRPRASPAWMHRRACIHGSIPLHERPRRRLGCADATDGEILPCPSVCPSRGGAYPLPCFDDRIDRRGTRVDGKDASMWLHR